MRSAGDSIAVLERAYDLSAAEDVWLEPIAEAIVRCIGGGGGVFVFDVHAASIVAENAFVSYDLAESDHHTAIRALGMTNDGFLANAFARDLMLGNTMCGTLHSLVGDRRSIESLAPLLDLQGFWAPRDVLGIIGRNPDGTGLGFSSPLPARSRLRKAFVTQWTCIATHLAAALRLRRSLAVRASEDGENGEDGESVIDPSNDRIAHAVGPAKAEAARVALRSAVRAVDRARSNVGRADPFSATELWRGLVAGRWTLIERYESDGRRYYVAHRNEPQSPALRALNLRERQVVAYAIQGQANKLIAYALGINPSTVANHLTSAQRKLGVRSRTELIHLARLLQVAQTSNTDAT
jgi:DNA-binding CsgD family transcriptional regulator